MSFEIPTTQGKRLSAVALVKHGQLSITYSVLCSPQLPLLFQSISWRSPAFPWYQGTHLYFSFSPSLLNNALPWGSSACWGDRQWAKWRKFSQAVNQSFYVNYEDSLSESDNRSLKSEKSDPGRIILIYALFSAESDIGYC